MIVVRLLRSVNTVVHLVIAAVAVPFAIWFPFDGYGLTHIPHFYVFFVVGVLGRKRIVQATERAGLRELAVVVAVAIALLALALLVPPLRALAYAVSPLAAVPAVLIVAAWLVRLRFIGSGLEYVGRRTLPIFLVHALVLQSAIWLVSAVRPDSAVALVIAPALASAVGIVIGLLAELLLRRSKGVISEPWRIARAAKP